MIKNTYIVGRRKKLFIFFVLILNLSSICFSNQLFKVNFNFDEIDVKTDDTGLHASSSEHYTSQWIKNPSFDNSTDGWNALIEGDSSDVNMNASDGCANFEILGEEKTFSILSDPPSSSNWTAVQNPNFPNFPDIFEINKYGCNVSHLFNDVTAVQDPCVHWDRNVTLPMNISDYIITSASIQAIVNATVDEDLDRYSDYLYSRFARINPYDTVDTYSVGDYIRYYVLISDLAKNKVYEISYFQTEQIGTGNPPGKDYLYDTYMISVPEEVLIFYLTSVLGTDNSHFTISLGIKLHIEDNLADYWDIDTFYELMIKYVNLTFTYEKKIDRLTSLYLNQIGPSLNGNNVEINAANLNFKYKIDSNWVSSLTLNSEMRVLINNYDTDISLNLNEMNNTFQELKIGGIDITSFILKDINITLSFQIFLADDFVLNRHIKISIDDVNLEISYVIYLEDPPPFDYFILIILISSLLIIALLGCLSFRAYILIPRKNKKDASLLLKAQRMKDIENIQAILLMHKPSGLPIFTQNYSTSLKVKKTLFSGFIQAISIIGDEISREESPKMKKLKSNEKDNFQKIIELDLKKFHCLILDLEELRSALILKHKSSKRLKEKMFHFSVALYLKISEQLKKWDNNLQFYKQIIPPIVNDLFELNYKNYFKPSTLESDISSLKKKYKLSRMECRIMSQVYLILQERSFFKLSDIIDNIKVKNEDLIITILESLIERKIIVPVNA